jgi:2,3-dihydroxyphenylpropionate 1,2-dioxygenase
MAAQLALCCMSHSPLLGIADPGAESGAKVAGALQEAREFAQGFDPDLVIIFGPDHYQGFRYELMPPFCVGAAATAVGDYGTTPGDLDVPQHLADQLVSHLLENDLDVAMSDRMRVDHGISQPLEILFDTSLAKPVIPVFINSVAMPLGPLRRIRKLGGAVGTFAAGLDRKVLLIGSGGLSHDPPIPKLRDAEPMAAEYLVFKQRTPEEQQQREEYIFQVGQEFARGESSQRSLNPELDKSILAMFEAGDLEKFDLFTVDWLDQEGGGSMHEVRTWIAAHAALQACGPYNTNFSFYEPVPEWIIGFGVTAALTQTIGR